jgi:O-antigen/teichoic acid export membrane protein
VSTAPSPTRRRLVAAGAVYASAGLGIAGTLIAYRVLGPTAGGSFALVIGVVQFISLLIELTSDEALVKFGFRYSAREDWARFHRVVRVTFAFELASSFVAAALIVAYAPFAGSIFNQAGSLTVPVLLAAPLPFLQSMESMGAQLLILRGRYDLRGLFLVYSMALRLVGLGLGARDGVTTAIAGLLAAQAVTSVSILAVGVVGLRRFPTAGAGRLGEDRGPFLRFIFQSSADTALDAFRTWIAPLALGVVRTATDVGLFRGAQSPQQGLAILSAPLRLILLTEQTRDWEHGRPEVVVATLRRYTAGAAVIVAIALVPGLLVMPWLVRLLLGDAYAPATNAARLILCAAAIQLVLGWTKSFPVTIGRPTLRIVGHAVEAAVLLPLILLFGDLWGVTGAGLAVLCSAIAFGAAWGVLVLRLRNEHRAAVARGSEGYFA